MLDPINLFSSPSAQPMLGRALSERFIESLGLPALLTIPLSGDRAYDFSGSNNTGTLNGGITVAPSGWGVLGQSWKRSTSATFVDSGKPIKLAKAFSVWIAFTIDASSTISNTARFLVQDSGSAGFGITSATGAGSAARFFLRGLTPVLADLSAVTISAGQQYFLGGAWNGAGTLTIVGAKVGSPLSSNSVAVTGTASEATTNFQIGGSTAGLLDNWKGNLLASGAFQAYLSVAQFSQLYNALLYGEPYPIFGPSVNERWWGNVVAAGGSIVERRTVSGSRTGSRCAA